MTWDDFALTWSKAYGGYDPRRASWIKQTFMRAVYKVSGVVRMSFSTTMLLSVACSVSVPLLAWKGGPWAAVAVLMLALGQFADAMSGARAVRSGYITRLQRFYQALVERFAELCWLLAFLALGAGPTAVVLCAFVLWAHEYLLAKVGRAVARHGGSTVGDRPLRVRFVVIALLLGALMSPIGADLAAAVVTTVVLCWLALGLIGLGQLFAIIRRVLT